MSSDRYGQFEFRGGHYALDFINTASARNREELVERLGSYGDLLDWSVKAGVIDADRAAELSDVSAAQPRAAASALRRAKGLREAGFRLFGALIEGAEPPPRDVALLNRRLRQAPRSDTVRWDGGGFFIDTPPPAVPLDEPLHLITRGIVEVLTGEGSDYVSRCDDADCSWLFLDRSPARARRWCSMADCGNRAKARRHYEKRKAHR